MHGISTIDGKAVDPVPQGAGPPLRAGISTRAVDDLVEAPPPPPGGVSSGDRIERR